MDETEFTLAIIHATDWSINRLADCLMTACTTVPRTLERFFPWCFFPLLCLHIFHYPKPVLPELNCNANPPITYYIFEKASYFPGKMRRIYSNSCNMKIFRNNPSLVCLFSKKKQAGTILLPGSQQVKCYHFVNKAMRNLRNQWDI